MRELRELSPIELEGKLVELREELSKEKGHIASGTRPDNPGRIKAVRRTVARILTIQRLKELEEKKEQKNEVLEKK